MNTLNIKGTLTKNLKLKQLKEREVKMEKKNFIINTGSQFNSEI